ncbi:MAG: DEAD/DEAH box helicase family protein, partial [Fibrobacteres bacterium]|nr:DEAD/DEAH box helicase family protein [Fibrobacterota bacterium]
MTIQPYPGQRWSSDAEPELGLGIITAKEFRTVEITFPTSGTVRRYTIASAPIRRIAFNVGDTIFNKEHERHTISGINADPTTNVITYICGDKEIPESSISDTVNLSTPLQRLLIGKTDMAVDFEDRINMLRFQASILKSEVRGFAGGRIELLPHQLYIADTVTSRRSIRILLADETGLGKTIEACLILHRLLLSGRINRILILLPAPLIHQWFVELLRRFNISFSLFSQEQLDEMPEDENPFTASACWIADLGLVSGKEDLFKKITEAGWDMIVVDEAHHLQKGGHESALVSILSEKVSNLIFLSATPEQKGIENSFLALKLLDPSRFAEFETYRKETLALKKLLEGLDNGKTKKPAELKKIQEKIDLFGIGRSTFRNTRRTIAGFPRRIVNIVPLNQLPKSEDPRVEWLIDLLLSTKKEKHLVICSTKEMAEGLQKAILKIVNLDSALFHEEMTIIQRDKYAAWFANIEGPRLLICSEIGSEGRNFQFCQSIILYDLPHNPELLEQRIGRLDRIGQKSEITVHIPFITGTSHEFLCRWFNEGLNAFHNNVPAAGRVFDELQGRLSEICSKEYSKTEADKIIEETKRLLNEFSSTITDPRDKLFEIVSSNAGRSKLLIEQIENPEQLRHLEIITGRLLRAYGVAIEESSPGTYSLNTDLLTDSTFPLPRGERPIITFNRKVALEREDVEFITIDNPILTGGLELFLSSERGTTALSMFTDPELKDPLLEVIYVVECIAPAALNANRFLPPTPIRILLDMNGKDLSEPLTERWLHVKTANAPFKVAESELNIIRNKIDHAVAEGEKTVQLIVNDVIKTAIDEMNNSYNTEIDRLKTLHARGNKEALSEQTIFEKEQTELADYLSDARSRIDAVRLILPFDPHQKKGRKKNQSI